MLADFLAASYSGAFVWGQSDCALWCADAVRHETGFDPAADLRGTYSTELECRRIVKSAGGLVALIAPRMMHPQLCPMVPPSPGIRPPDGVAILRADGQTICGLIVDGRAATRRGGAVRLHDDFQILRGWLCLRH
jgi:hypothetical protein